MTEAARAGTRPSTSAEYKDSGSRSVYLYLASPRGSRRVAFGNYERKEILCKKKGVTNTKKVFDFPKKILINALKCLPPQAGSFQRTAERQKLLEAFSVAEFIGVPRELLAQPEHAAIAPHCKGRRSANSPPKGRSL